jgi:hypothetical protein
VPLCSPGLPRIGVRQAVRDKHVVGPHTVIPRGFWRCAGVYRVDGMARLEEIRTGFENDVASLEPQSTTGEKSPYHSLTTILAKEKLKHGF